MKKQKNWTVVLMIVIGVISAIVSNGILGMVFTSLYAIWVIGMMIAWQSEGRLDILNRVEE